MTGNGSLSESRGGELRSEIGEQASIETYSNFVRESQRIRAHHSYCSESATHTKNQAGVWSENSYLPIRDSTEKPKIYLGCQLRPSCKGGKKGRRTQK